MIARGKQKSPFSYLDRVQGRGPGDIKSEIQGVGYDIAVTSRTRRQLATIAGLTASADRHLSRTTLGKLREICRAHDRQSSVFSGMLDRAGDNVFGSDFNFIPNTGDKDTNKRVSDYISRRMERDMCDASGLMDFAEMGKLALRAIWNDGDVLWAKRKAGNMLAFEADQIETPAGRGKKRIIMGVELNDDNRPLAYHVRMRSTRADSGAVDFNQSSTRLVAADAIVPAFRKRFNQTRGLPYLAAALSYYSRLHNYIDNEALAAEVNSMQGVKIKREDGDVTLDGTEDNDDTTSTFEKLQKFEPFTVYDLLPGEDVEMFGSTRPGDTFEPYIVTVCRLVGVAVGYPLELMLLDFSKTNYSSARASLGEARKMFRAWQKFCLLHMCRPWYRWQITRGIASGALSPAKDIYKFRTQWPAWPYIDPVKSANANKISINTRTKSISQCIRETGKVPEEVFAEMAADQETMKSLGLTVSEAKPPEAKQPEPIQPPEESKETADKGDKDDK